MRRAQGLRCPNSSQPPLSLTAQKTLALENTFKPDDIYAHVPHVDTDKMYSWAARFFFFLRCPPEELVEILETVNPANKAGRVTLITRMSSKYLDEHLPKLILAVQKAGLNVSVFTDFFPSKSSSLVEWEPELVTHNEDFLSSPAPSPYHPLR